MANQKRIPFIPKQTIDFKPMQYFYCETDHQATDISRTTFLHLLEAQPCPMAQVYVDLEGGNAYLFPYDANRAENFLQLNREMETDYKRCWREKQALRTGTRVRDLYLDQELGEEGITLGDTLSTGDTPETLLLTQERTACHRAAFSALSRADQEVLLSYFNAGCNARELARRLGKDPSGVTKLVKRAGARLQKNLEKDF